jgi:hypothetical protein
MIRKGRFKAEMGNLIAKDQLCIHPFVVAELASGTLPSGKRHSLTLTNLPLCPSRVWLTCDS